LKSLLLDAIIIKFKQKLFLWEEKRMGNPMEKQLWLEKMEGAFEIYKKLFLKFTLWSLLFHLPLYVYPLFVGPIMGDTNPFFNESFMVFQGIFVWVLRPIFAGYLTVKLYATFTKMFGVKTGAFTISFSDLWKKGLSVLGYVFFWRILLLLFVQTGISVLFILGFFLIDRTVFLNLFPQIVISPNLGFTEAFLSLLLSLAMWVWVIHMVVRWMFGYQAIFIENLNGLKSMRRSYLMTKGFVKRILLSWIMFYLFLVWFVGSVIAFLYLLASFYFPAFIPSSLHVPFLISVSGALFYPFYIAWMTYIYILLKFEKDALSLEWKMAKMMEKVEYKASEKLEGTLFPLRVQQHSHLKMDTVVGLFPRFVAGAIDLIVVVIVGCFIGLMVHFLSGGSFFPQVLFWFRPEHWREEGLELTMQIIGILFLAHILILAPFEILTKGLTPGKKFIGAKRIYEEGAPPSHTALAILTLTRFLDYLPLFYLGGFVFMAFRKDKRTLGDLLTKTYLVYARKEQSKAKSFALDWGNNLPPRVNEFPVTDLEREVLAEYLQIETLDPDRKKFFEQNLFYYFIKKFNVQVPCKEPSQWFQDIVEMNRRMGR
jgi:uncharacterized RDD family membrane protein YckC